MEVIMQQIAPAILILVGILFVIIGFIQKLRQAPLPSGHRLLV